MVKRHYKATRLQKNKSGQYSLTIPFWIVEKVLQARKGDRIEFDFQGDKVILNKSKQEDKNQNDKRNTD